MSRNPRLEQLVRDSLGCNCPDEVFRDIDELPSAPDGPVTRSWVIGDRLMVQILPTDDARALATRLPELLAAARRERDRRGLNRARLVIASDDPAAPGLVYCVTPGGTFRAPRKRQDKAQCAGNGCSLVKRCNAVMVLSGGSLRASRWPAICGVALA